MLKLYFPFQFGETYKISQVFGVNPQIYKRFGLKAHNGIDWATPYKTSICAIANGTVIDVGNEGWRTGYGRYIKIQHEGYQSTYGHLKLYFVQKGDQVKQNNKIGLADNTGFSTGHHLHLTIKETDASGNVLNKTNGYLGAINPLSLLNEPTNPDLISSPWAADDWLWALQNGLVNEKSLPRDHMTTERFIVLLKNYYDKFKK